MKKPILLSTIFLFLVHNTIAQIPTIQDCLGAIPVCQQIYMEAQFPSGEGNYPNEINPNISCTVGEINTIWYTFTTQEAGELGFLIIPNNLDDDYDWSLYNITNASCEDIFTDPSLEVSCNVSGGGNCHGETGANGDTPYNEQGPGCGTEPPTQFNGFTPFNDFVPMEANETYVLMISNWTNSNNGYTLDFGLSTGLGIIDENPPEIAELTTPSQCNEDEIMIAFSENIQCGSIDADNFQLTGPGGPYTINLVSDICIQGGEYDNTFLLSIDPPIASMGTFELELINDDNSDVLDLCSNPANPISIEFEVDEPIAIDVNIGADTSLVCVGDELLLDATTPTSIDYLWQDNSQEPTFTVTNPGSYSVTVTDACGNGADTIEVIYLMDIPQVELGEDMTLCDGETLMLDVTSPFATYIWQDGSIGSTYLVTESGQYSVDVTNACGTVTEALTIDYIEPIVLELGNNQILCPDETLVLSVEHPTATFLWQDGSTSAEYTISAPGDYSVTVTTICDEQIDQINIVYLEEDDAPELGEDRTLCQEDTLNFDLTIPGAQYQWQDGTTDPTYQITTSGDYAVTVETACNVFEEFLSVEYLEPLSVDLGQDTFLCPGERLVLNASSGGSAQYAWQDGSTASTFIASEPGSYLVSVFNQCQTIFDELEVAECEFCDVFLPNVFSPNGDGFNDFFQPLSDCTLEKYRLQIYDRWGNQLFETTQVNNGWDGTFKGKTVNPAVYVWWMEYTVLENNRSRSEVIMGDVSVLR